uniref:Venom peptide HtC6Tx3 n=1 Tax=Hadogenes troglodytes TaxID=1577150 RepID=A0A1B3IJ04_9SCOR|nr:venom peptide HtC6Tx3 [Hadogenes troglodytes]
MRVIPSILVLLLLISTGLEACPFQKDRCIRSCHQRGYKNSKCTGFLYFTCKCLDWKGNDKGKKLFWE